MSSEEIKCYEVFRCPECGSERINRDYNRGETTCTNCGTVISDFMISTGPERPAYTKEEEKERSRAGPRLTLRLLDQGLGSIISRSPRDIHRRDLPLTRRAPIGRLRRWQAQIVQSGTIERNLAQAMPELNRIISQLGLSKYQLGEAAALIYRKALKTRLGRGKIINAMVAASVYLACRQNKIPTSLDEIRKVSKVTQKQLARHVRLIIQGMEEKKFPRQKPRQFLEKIATALDLPRNIKKKALKIILDLETLGVFTQGKRPQTVVAAAIYIAALLSGTRITQKEIEKVTKVTEVTIRNIYKKICKKLRISVESKFSRPKNSKITSER